MPIFDFYCQKCDKKFESLVLGSKPISTEDCPDCGAEECPKVLSTFGSYSIKGNNQASTSPRGTTRFKRGN